MLYAKGKIKIN